MGLLLVLADGDGDIDRTITVSRAVEVVARLLDRVADLAIAVSVRLGIARTCVLTAEEQANT